MRRHPAAAAILLAMTAPVALADAVEVAPPGWDTDDVSMSVGIGNEWFNDIQLNWTASIDPQTGKTVYSLNGGPITLTASDNSTLTIGGASFDPDPFLLFSANATNNGSNPQVFSFAFNTPLTPVLTGSISSHAEMGVTLTDGLNDGATVQPLVGQGSMLRSFDLFANGGSVSKNVDIGTAFSIFSGTGGTTFSADSTLVCGQPCVTMSALLSFTLTAHDSVGFSGKVVQASQVPLPGALVLFGSGRLGLLGLRRRQPAPQAGAAPRRHGLTHSVQGGASPIATWAELFRMKPSM